MTVQPWWERWPTVLEREQNALREAGIEFKKDESALKKGILRLDLVLPAEFGGHRLNVVYPDHYPYFRFQVYAPDLKLPYHQNPFERNLCLIGRRTHWWKTTDTAAGLILKQLPKVLETAGTNDLVAVGDKEEHQAEPVSDHYSYAHSIILIDSEWSIPKSHRQGHLLIGVLPPPPRELPAALIRGAVLQVLSESGEVLCSASDALRTTFSGGPFHGRWVRVDTPIMESHPLAFLNYLVEKHPGLSPRFNHVKWEAQDDRWLRIVAALFPEQTSHRKEGEGWVFACAVDKNLPKTGNIPRPHLKDGSKYKGSKKRHK